MINYEISAYNDVAVIYLCRNPPEITFILSSPINYVRIVSEWLIASTSPDYIGKSKCYGGDYVNVEDMEAIKEIKEITVAYIESVIDDFDWDDLKEEAIYDFIRGLDDVLSEVEIKSDRSED